MSTGSARLRIAPLVPHPHLRGLSLVNREETPTANAAPNAVTIDGQRHLCPRRLAVSSLDRSTEPV